MHPDVCLPQSQHFSLERLADGVFAAIAVDGAGAMSNAGIVDLGDRTLVFDTLWTPQAARDLRTAAEALTGHRAAYVVNSHFHGDHVQGNQAFAPDAEILATPGTRELIAERTAKTVEQHRGDADSMTGYLREQEGLIARESDPEKRRRLALGLAGMREYGAALPDLRIVLPDIAFDSRLVVHGSRRSAELLTYGGGHTPSDAFLLLPDDRILFAGDLVVVEHHPWLGHGDVVAWPQILSRMQQLAFDTLVPGHGPVGTRDDIPFVKGYIADLLRLAHMLVREGWTADEAAAAQIPDHYAALGAGEVFPRNMRYLHEFVLDRQREAEEES